MGIDLDEYREQSLRSWDEMAAGWEARRQWLISNTAAVIDWLARGVDAQPGQTVLEIACGPGDLGLRLAGELGDSGRVICTDFAPQMVEVARRNGSAHGLANVEYRVLDAEHMDLDDDSVDAAVCRWGYMLMADPEAALRETRRVLRAGGPLCFAVWDAPQENPWAALPAITMVQRGHIPPPEPQAPGMFAMADPQRTRSLLRAAGFSEPELERISFSFRYADFDDYWDSIVRLAGPLARALAALPEGERQATRAAIEEAAAPLRSDDGSYVAPACSWGVRAR